jgi:hypothetical protein
MACTSVESKSERLISHGAHGTTCSIFKIPARTNFWIVRLLTPQYFTAWPWVKILASAIVRFRLAILLRCRAVVTRCSFQRLTDGPKAAESQLYRQELDPNDSS